MFDLDVFIPTLKQRTDNMLCQAHTVLNSGLNVRLTVSLPDNDYPELMDNLTPKEKEKVRLIPNVPQGEPSIPVKHCIENIDWSDWMYFPADDDCVLPWGLKHLWEGRDGVSMVIGQTLGVSRKEHLDFSAWKIGYGVIPCHVSTALFHMPSLKSLPKPWYNIGPLADYELIKYMSANFAYKIIPSVVHVQAFAELENLGTEFASQFKMLYGHLLQ